MAIDSTFYQVTHPIVSTDIPQIVSASLYNDRPCAITHACMPDEAADGALIYITQQAFLDSLPVTRNITIITTPELAALCPSEAAIVTTKAPRIAFSQIVAHIYQEKGAPLIDPTAQIASDAVIGANVSLGAYCVIEAGAIIGEGAIIGAHSFIGANCEIGPHCVIESHVSLRFCRIGTHVVIHAHSVIGKAGFGFEMTSDGAVMVPHLGLVSIGNHVNIGAHCVIDKGVLGETLIADNVMIDNHVHIAHNVHIGANTIVLAQVGIAGSVVIGKNVILAGQVGIKDHVSIVDGTIILSAAKVTKDITIAGTYGGYPAIPAKQHWREQAAIRRLVAQKRKGE